MKYTKLTQSQAQFIENENYDQNIIYYLVHEDNKFIGLGRTIDIQIDEDGQSGKNTFKVDFTPREINIEEVLNYAD